MTPKFHEGWFNFRLKIHGWITWCLFPKWTELRLGKMERMARHDAYVCGLCRSVISGHVIRKRKVRSCPICDKE